MPFVTQLTLESGDSDVLESVVADIKATAQRKGIEFKGPHPKPPTVYSVPQHAGVATDERFDPWSYTVYTRTIEIVGSDSFAKDVATEGFPDRVHVSAAIEQTR